ncbi:hypothetical protein DL766_006238 [Monosporascus sp. MC13-8B]|uniref:FAD-binding PCMH-type domain-containing protein n=1 Tax=Monosporascus cannonballus TaxID=155416 RepID=A0ABY0H224_9PEZI|nr:hypothetical protein DL762_006416 [Monosporascus cannonballus]RYO91187.1 hypothetical protein DL763_005057 [Monosporascus cannonballus]RYP27738.1 hypothetical protein DL766_006238 [Monosporascus sp. MC13-8B]
MDKIDAALVIENLRQAGLGDVLYVPGQESYEARIASYRSLTQRLKPWAFVQPRSTEEVSQAVKAIVRTNDCKFAIRSGGHMCWAGANNIESGVTIDLQLLDAVTYNPKTEIASLGPGARWTNVYTQLEEHGVLVGGAREGLVAVGGFILGGGNTFFSCRGGFACDQVVNFEVVLADGSIVEANATTNPDLFQVLKGGSNNFGIVTRFDLRTFKAMEIWDGNCVFAKSSTNDLIRALMGFTGNLTVSPDAHFLGMWTYTRQVKDIYVMGILTSFDGVENPKSLRHFMAIPGRKNMKKTTIAKKMADFGMPAGRHERWFTLTFKLDIRIVKKSTDVFEQFVERLEGVIPDGNFTHYMVLQPLPASFAKHSVAHGGNVLGLDRVHEDCILFMTILEVATSQLAETVYPSFKAAVEEVESYAKSVDGNIEFRYLNYCDSSQDPLGSYGKENIKKMRDAAAKYDPDGIFQKRVPGGFKISNVKV